MKLTFYIDPQTGYPHIYKHGVEEQEVLELMDNPGLELKGRGDSKTLLGQTEAGRYLKVIFTDSRDEPGALFVITAYDLTGKALKAYKRRKRKKQ